MGNTPSTAARLAFFGMTDESEAAAIRSRVDAVASGHSGAAIADPGPSAWHRVHGAIVLGPGDELRVTSQAERRNPRTADIAPARIAIRRWYLKHDGTWWINADLKGIFVTVGNVADFAKAVNEAARYILGGGVQP